MTTPPVAVIGSGPSAFACCRALIARGIRPLVVDAGLDPSSASHRVAAAAPDGLPEKTVRGSDHPYRIPLGRTWEASGEVGVLPSFAMGGHSTVWGSAMLPYGREELRGWPITVAELEPHYRAILRALPLSGAKDNLAARFPLYTKPTGTVPAGARIERMLTKAAQRPPDPNVQIGRSRLAVAAQPPEDGGCSACGLCMQGCPDHLIFDAGRQVRQLADQGLIEYRPGLVVTQWSRPNGQLTLDVEDLDGKRQPSIAVGRLFIAAGVLSTAEIVVRSLGLWGRSVRILDSQYFVGPLLSYRPETATELATLAQAFVEVRYGSEPWASAHCQIYPPNHFSEAAIRVRAGRVPGGDRIARWLSRRVLPVQGFLPSQDSGHLTLTLSSRSSRGPTIDGHPSTKSMAAIRKCSWVLLRAQAQLGGPFIMPAVEIAEVGRSFHIGGSFPMRAASRHEEMATDLLGRLCGEPDVHLADASTLPSVAGTTITLTVMANAHRIASVADVGSEG